MAWMKYHYGTAYDPKFDLVTKLSGMPATQRSITFHAWMYILEHAGEHDGSIASLLDAVLAIVIRKKEKVASAIISAFKQIGMIQADGQLTTWDSRQGQRGHLTSDREPPKTDAERARAYRQRKNCPVTRHVTDVTDVTDVTKSVTEDITGSTDQVEKTEENCGKIDRHASRHVTLDKIRIDKIREDNKKQEEISLRSISSSGEPTTHECVSHVPVCESDEAETIQKLTPSAEPAPDEPPAEPASSASSADPPEILPALLDLTPTTADPVQQAFNRYNHAAKTTGLLVAQKLTPGRRSKIKARLKECGGLNGWDAALEKLAASDFCTGAKTDWRADLDFLIQESSFIKLMEGRYDNHTSPNKPRSAAEALCAGADMLMAAFNRKDAMGASHPDPGAEGDINIYPPGF